jgi:ATP/maltotriose-dependent transcriptional regulator MalT
VLILVAEGLSNQQIAEKLVLSQGTIKKYLSSVYQKLYVHRRTQALLRAKELGIL